MEEKETLLNLVRLGIGHSSNPPLEDVDWPAMKDLADMHGLSAVVLDGLPLLGNLEAAQIPEMFRLEWTGEVWQDFEMTYQQYENAIGSLAGWYNKHGFKMMVLKGYACSLDWPNPKHRPCGDIDMSQLEKVQFFETVFRGTFVLS